MLGLFESLPLVGTLLLLCPVATARAEQLAYLVLLSTCRKIHLHTPDLFPLFETAVSMANSVFFLGWNATVDEQEDYT